MISKQSASPLQLALFSFTYFALGALGLTLALAPGYSSPVFPAAGLGLVLALRYGAAGGAAVFLGSFALNLLIAPNGSLPFIQELAVAAQIATGAALQALLGALLVRLVLPKGWTYLDNEKAIFQFLGLGGVLACLVSASTGTLALSLFGVLAPEQISFTWWTWYVGDTLGVFVVAPFCLLLLKDNRQTDWQRLRFVGLPVVIVLLFSGAAYVATAKWQESKLRQTITSEGEHVQRQLNARVIAHEEMLASLARLIEVNPGITPEQFDYFTLLTLADQTDVFALSFNPLLRDASRVEFESAMQKQLSDPNFQVRERDAQKNLQAAQPRTFYVPVAMISPMAGNRPALGFDIYSEPVRKRAIENSVVTRKRAVTEPIRLVQEQQERMGVLLLQPIFEQNSRQTHPPVIGFAVGVIKVDEMVEIALGSRLANRFQLRIVDAQAQDDPSRDFVGAFNMPVQGALATGYEWQSVLRLADRDWNVQLIPTRAFLEAQRPLSVWLVGVVGLLFIAVLQVMLMVFSGRAELVRRKVKEQTYFIEEQKLQLKVAIDAAQAASAAKSRFLATMSHELRTPLNGMLGVGRIIQLEATDEKVREQAEVLLNSGEMLLSLLNDTLDLAKVEAGKLALHTAAFSPHDTLAQLQKLYQAQTMHKNLVLKTECTLPAGVRLVGDPGRIKQAVSNLVSNALKFTDQGEVLVRLSAKVNYQLGSQQRVKVLLEVIDTGCGIPADKLQHLFVPFSQLDDSYKRRHGGTGLGLSIVKSLAELMGGTVGVESTPGKGSTFWFTADLEVLPAPAELQVPQPEKAAGMGDSLPLFDGRVLVVEDDVTNQMVIKALLSKLGVQCVLARDGQAAMDILATNPDLDLVLMDLHMPKMDGFETTAAIRAGQQMGRIKQLPVVALSASVFPEEKQRCIDFGMAGFLAKPIHLEQLAELLARFLERK